MTRSRFDARRWGAAAVAVLTASLVLATVTPAAVQAAGAPGLVTDPETSPGGAVELGTIDVAAQRAPRLRVGLGGDGFARILAVVSPSGHTVDGCVGQTVNDQIVTWCELVVHDTSGQRGSRSASICLDYQTGPSHAPDPRQRWCTNASWWAASKPGVPGLAAEPGPAAGQVTLTWTAPADTGGVPFRYTAVLRDDDDTPYDDPGTYLELAYDERDRQRLVVGDLTPGRQLLLSGFAANGAHFSERTPHVFVTVPGLPAAPEPVQARRRLGGPVELNWSLPATDGGGPVLHYEVYRVDGGTRRLVTRTPQLSTTDDPGLPLVGTYTYVVAAVTRFGRGPDSKPVTAPVVSGT